MKYLIIFLWRHTLSRLIPCAIIAAKWMYVSLCCTHFPVFGTLLLENTLALRNLICYLPKIKISKYQSASLSCPWRNMSACLGKSDTVSSVTVPSPTWRTCCANFMLIPARPGFAALTVFSFASFRWLWSAEHKCVCVCVCEMERENEWAHSAWRLLASSSKIRPQQIKTSERVTRQINFFLKDTAGTRCFFRINLNVTMTSRLYIKNLYSVQERWPASLRC